MVYGLLRHTGMAYAPRAVPCVLPLAACLATYLAALKVTRPAGCLPRWMPGRRRKELPSELPVRQRN